MKQVGLLLFINLMVNSTYAEFIPTNIYQIISDVKVDSVPVGMCLVKGEIYEAYSGDPVFLAFVGTSYVDKKYVITDENGEYEMLINASDSIFYFYHSNYGEIVVTNFDFKSQHLVTINFLTGPSVQTPIMVKKPVIYMYSTKTVNAELFLKPKGELIFSYPIYKNSWKVKVAANGQLEVDGALYPYLFWESKHEELNFIQTKGVVDGFYIKTDSTLQFLETFLRKIGLNSTEKTDFITYWAPRLMEYQFATIQFLLNESYAKEIAQLTVSPSPTNELRVFMLFQGFDNDVPPNYLVEPKFTPFSRQGFTLVEWGGAEL